MNEPFIEIEVEGPRGVVSICITYAHIAFAALAIAAISVMH